MDAIEIKIPKLEDFEPYRAAVERLKEIAAALIDTQNAVNSHGLPLLGAAEDIGDETLEAAVTAHAKLVEAHQKAGHKLEVKLQTLQRLRQQAEIPIAELHRQAVEFIGAAAREQHLVVVDSLEVARATFLAMLRKERLIRMALASEVNRKVPGYLGWDSGLRFCPSVNPHTPEAL